MSTGDVMAKEHSLICTNGSDSIPDIYDKKSEIRDNIDWVITLTAPEDAASFKFRYVFFSTEYDEFISSDFNDKFYVILNAPETTHGMDKVINYTECRDPDKYVDFEGKECDTPSGKCCYIAVNTALSDCCWYPAGSAYAENPDGPACPDKTKENTDISGTGFECAKDKKSDSHLTGSSTGWLETSWPIKPNETFTLTFHIHDTEDGEFDSQVIIDAFEFSKKIEQGTIIIQ
jgi:hypothetical protein